MVIEILVAWPLVVSTGRFFVCGSQRRLRSGRASLGWDDRELRSASEGFRSAGESARRHRSQLKEIEFDLFVAVFSSPKIQGDAGEFVDDRIGEPGLGEVDGLEVTLAAVAAVDPDVRKLVGGVNRKFLVVFFSAVGADEAAEIPFSQAEGTDESPLAAVAQGTKHGDAGFASAERAHGARVSVRVGFGAEASEFGIGLEEGAREEFVRRGRSVGRADAKAVPETVEEFGLSFVRCRSKLACRFGEVRRAVVFHEREK
jgi:hypothetical protein